MATGRTDETSEPTVDRKWAHITEGDAYKYYTTLTGAESEY